MEKTMKAWTDYPFIQLGDIAYQEAPIREIEVLSYDGDKYCRIIVCGIHEEIKSGYIYQEPGRCREVPGIARAQLKLLEKQ
jgi:hypothetical protein